jgi:7-cyano-7-deazaguanine synthase
MKQALLFSGGLDSTALAAWRRPSVALFVDYGQLPAEGELAAATSVSEAIDLPLERVRVESSSIGSGLLAGSHSSSAAPTREWWPFRNQLLATIAATWAVDRDIREIWLGSVATDGERHADGRADFYEALDRVVSLQEGGIHVVAPAIGLTTAQLITASEVPDRVLAWTHSCHASSLACGSCPGCVKRRSVLEELGRIV